MAAGDTANDPGGGSAATPVAVAPGDADGLSPLALLGLGLAGAGLVTYLGVYLVQAANARRYREGFILSRCPVCETGQLYTDDRHYRTLGIPRVRRTVRCDTCRSVLRQVGEDQWRYAVDGAANPEMFHSYNAQVVSEQRLLDIAPDYRHLHLETLDGEDLS